MSKKAKKELGFNRASGKLHGSLSKLMSNFRLSLTFRIALHYCWQLLRTTATTLLIITLVFMLLQIPPMEDTIHRLRFSQPASGQSFDQTHIQNSKATAWLEPPHTPDSAKRVFQSCYLADDPLKLVVVTTHQSGQHLHTAFQLSQTVTGWLVLMLAVLLTDAFRVSYFMCKRQRLDKKVLAPIREITDMAATLSASNLSNRINVAGMKNELRDLATVINAMLDRIERSYNSQKQFVSDASHELRTPIAVIQGYVNMLNRWGKDDRTVLEEGISAIAQETASMKELVDSLLFLARHDKKTLMMEISSFDVLDVMTELHREAAMVTPEDNFILSPSDHCVIEADRSMIKQVMRILCDNAVKYTPKGGTISMGVTHKAGGCILTLSDTGSGIAPDELPKIFDRFYRSDSARKAESSGHGLGLSIARIIVIAHSGKMHVRSKVGEGTTFSIELPASQKMLHTAQLKQSV